MSRWILAKDRAVTVGAEFRNNGNDHREHSCNFALARRRRYVAEKSSVFQSVAPAQVGRDAIGKSLVLNNSSRICHHGCGPTMFGGRIDLHMAGVDPQALQLDVYQLCKAIVRHTFYGHLIFPFEIAMRDRGAEY